MSENITKGDWEYLSTFAVYDNKIDYLVCSNVANNEDGYLLASAPDLLEACELALLRTKLLVYGLGIKLNEEPNLIDTLEKALRKAKGEKQLINY